MKRLLRLACEIGSRFDMFFGHRPGAGAEDHLPERRHGLEHVPKKLTDFFHQNMLPLLESERFLYDQMILSDREAL